MGVAIGDVDADGDPDLYLSGVGDGRLLINEGGRFRDASASNGFPREEGRWGSGCTFFDADGDQDLDLFVCSYVRWSMEIDGEVNYTLDGVGRAYGCLLYTSPSPRDATLSRMPSSA